MAMQRLIRNDCQKAGPTWGVPDVSRLTINGTSDERHHHGTCATVEKDLTVRPANSSSTMNITNFTSTFSVAGSTPRILCHELSVDVYKKAKRLRLQAPSAGR